MNSEKWIDWDIHCPKQYLNNRYRAFWVFIELKCPYIQFNIYLIVIWQSGRRICYWNCGVVHEQLAAISPKTKKQTSFFADQWAKTLLKSRQSKLLLFNNNYYWEIHFLFETSCLWKSYWESLKSLLLVTVFFWASQLLELFPGKYDFASIVSLAKIAGVFIYQGNWD